MLNTNNNHKTEQCESEGQSYPEFDSNAYQFKESNLEVEMNLLEPKNNELVVLKENPESPINGSTEIIKNGKWSSDEDEELSNLVKIYGRKNWKKIASNILGRTAVQCLHRWTKILQPGLVKGPWTINEDSQLMEWVTIKGPYRWSHCSEVIKGRSGKQCRERWFNTLNPNVKKGQWSEEEDYTIFKLFSEYGSKWSKIAAQFKGRTENAIKNRFYSTLRRIYSEKKKTDNTEGNFSAAHLNLEELLQYFPDAFKEKATVYEKFKMQKTNLQKNQMLNKKLKRQENEDQIDFVKKEISLESVHANQANHEKKINNLTNINSVNNITYNTETFTQDFSPQFRNLDNFQTNKETIQNNNFNIYNQNAFNLNNLYLQPSQNIDLLNVIAHLNQISYNLINTKNELTKYDNIKNNFFMMANSNNVSSMGLFNSNNISQNK